MKDKVSLIVLYSADRKRQLETCLECWDEMNGFRDFQKILVVDGKTNITPPEWEVVEVIRETEFYCWAHALNAGIERANSEYVFYLDSDRVLENDYFERAISALQSNGGFVFPSRLFTVKNFDADASTLKQLVAHPNESELIPDHRVMNPLKVGFKNPFSGCVGFKKELYLETGGFDPAFRGWGYPDYDYFMNVISRGLKLTPLDTTELHQRHLYSGDQMEVYKHNLWNLNQYMKKWNLDESILWEIGRRRLNKKQFAGCKAALKRAKSLSEFLLFGFDEPLLC